ncbi:hypothetical protein TNCV_4255191 [Trichonephila clavipes]|nr:hypothetical protein TNCV_4255191 [Trichonephila clavipes]
MFAAILSFVTTTIKQFEEVLFLIIGVEADLQSVLFDAGLACSHPRMSKLTTEDLADDPLLVLNILRVYEAMDLV